MANCPHTIGVEFGTRIIEVAGQKIKLQIWDTGKIHTAVLQFCNILLKKKNSCPSYLIDVEKRPFLSNSKMSICNTSFTSIL